jgi:glycosyltransferase involved in cell wall biosynthesis
MKNVNPLISIVIPVYNQAEYLPQALDSVIHQTYKNLEIIVIDDGSMDSTQEICESYLKKEPRLKILKQQNQGPASARNKAIAETKGDYIGLLDADDVMDLTRIDVQYKVIRSDSNIDIVYTALNSMDDKGNITGRIGSQDYPPQDFLAQMFFRNMIPGPSTIMAKRECLASHPYKETFKHAEDYELMLRLAHIYRFKYIDQPLTSYRRHTQNLSNDLISHRTAEKKVLQCYSPTHIAKIVAQTSYTEEQKALLLGKILFNLEAISEALDIFKQFQSAIALFYSGNCHLYLGENEKAIQCYQESLKMDVTNPAVYNNYGVALARIGDKKKGEEFFKKAIKLRPIYLDPQYNLDTPFPPESLHITWRELRTDLIHYQQKNILAG